MTHVRISFPMAATAPAASLTWVGSRSAHQRMLSASASAPLDPSTYACVGSCLRLKCPAFILDHTLSSVDLVSLLHSGGHYHSQSPEAYFAHTPGLKVFPTFPPQPSRCDSYLAHTLGLKAFPRRRHAQEASPPLPWLTTFFSSGCLSARRRHGQGAAPRVSAIVRSQSDDLP